MGAIRKLGKRLLAGPRWIAAPAKACLDWYESVYGPVYARRNYMASIANGRSVIRALEQIKQRWPGLKSDERQAPVFILSAGWRSGSTLMQRLIMSRQSILVWGEPYSHARIISHLADSVTAITENWPEKGWFVDEYDLEQTDSTFVANMYPPVKDLQQACLAYLKTLLDDPAKKRGYDRWGVKDVRLSIEDAYFIRWLYPEAKFIFLCRNPYDAYSSYRTDRSWYFEWPDKPVFTAAEFGKNWSMLATGFYEGASDIGGLLVRYEDLVNGDIDIAVLEKYLDIEIDASLLVKKVGSHRNQNKAIPSRELKQLKREVYIAAEKLGYM